MEEQVELDRVLRKVRGLIAKAEALGLDTPEGEACQERADSMMERYAIDQAKLRESAPVEEQAKPGHMNMDVCPAGSPYESPITSLVVAVAMHCRCQVVFSRANMDKGLVEDLKSLGTEVNVIARVFGYQSDLKYFEILFTVLHLHMAGGYDPKVNWGASDEDNAYVLHSAGLNWRAIARAFGPSHPMGWDGVIRKDDGGHLGRAGAYWHACYRRAVRARGEQEIKLPKFSDGSERKLIEYRYNFAESYAATVHRRLTEIRNSRQSGGELVLVSSAEKIRDMINEMFPDRNTIEYGAKPAYNPNAWAAGNKRGLEADLNANTRVSNPARPELS